MCGIAGIFRFGDRVVDRSKLTRMTRALAHRGPDGYGHEVLGRCGLGHRRLAIIDLSKSGKQPMSTPDGKLWVSFNGEIYNYVELRDELEQHGHQFVSQSDTEVILHAYRQWGADAFQRFNGMWGIALYDVQDELLILSRDRIGIKPLYIHRTAERLLFASEIKALLAAEPELAQLDRASVARFLLRPMLAYGRSTFFDNIEAVAPATFVQVTTKGVDRPRKYWTFKPTRPTPLDRAQAASAVQRTLTDALRLRFRSDVPVGTCLSGGLDSSSIVGLSGHALSRTPQTFSAVYAQKEFAEGHFVDAMVDAYDLTSHKVEPTGLDMDAVLSKASYYQEAPTAGPGVYTQWHVMDLARGRVKVLLDGQGGDELFAGYPRYFAPYVRGLVENGLQNRRPAPQKLWQAFRDSSAIADLTGTNPLLELAGHAQNRLRRMVGLRSRIAPAVAPLLHPDLARTIESERDSWRQPKLTKDPLTDTLWDTVVRTSLPYLLHHEDRNSMAFSLEARVPFLDHRLVELAFSLPSEHKIRGAVTKAVLRDAVEHVLPKMVHKRKDKLGFPTPFSTWMKTESHFDWADDLLVSPQVIQRGFVNERAVRDLLRAHRMGQKNHAPTLYHLVTLEMFCRRFIDGRFEMEAPPAWALKDDEGSAA